MRCEDVKELVPLRPLDLLDPREEAAVREHLEGGCPRCAAEAAAARVTLDQLPFALPLEEPSPVAKARLMAAIKSEEARSAAGPSSAAARAAAAAGWLRIAAASFAAAIAAGALTGYVMIGRQDELVARHEAEASELRAQASRQGEELAALRRQVREAADSIQLASAPGVRVVDLEGRGPRAESAARVFWDPRRGRWQLYAANLPDPGQGRTYQLWLITADGAKISAGTFEPEGPAPARGTVTLPPGAGAALAAVTDEPEGGSPQPTGAILLAGRV